jgi:hypothetical protein
MKNRQVLIRSLILSLTLSFITPLAFAGEVKNREENQQDRIAQGVKSGQLTPQEAANLEKSEAKIEKDRQAALADGKLTPKEKAKLNREENKQSKKIYQKKHNRKKVTPPPSQPQA